MSVSTSGVTYELQLAPLLQQPARLDADGYIASYNGHELRNRSSFNSFISNSHPVFLTLSEAPHQTLPARFLLRLQPPMPLLMSFIPKITMITGWVAPPFILRMFKFSDAL